MLNVNYFIVKLIASPLCSRSVAYKTLFFTRIVEACDERVIPAVTHATYTVTKEPLRGNFALPNRVNVTYECDEGYALQYPENYTVGCEYITRRRSDFEDVIAEALWTSTDGIICKPGEYVRWLTLQNVNCNKML